jgi:hypothetical protein
MAERQQQQQQQHAPSTGRATTELPMDSATEHCPKTGPVDIMRSRHDICRTHALQLAIAITCLGPVRRNTGRAGKPMCMQMQCCK